MTSVRFLCLVNAGGRVLKARSVWLQSPALELTFMEGPLHAGCYAECSLYSELSKLLDPGLGELSGWWETKHRGHRAGGCLRPTVCDSVLYEVVCTQGDNLL